MFSGANDTPEQTGQIEPAQSMQIFADAPMVQDENPIERSRVQIEETDFTLATREDKVTFRFEEETKENMEID